MGCDSGGMPKVDEPEARPGTEKNFSESPHLPPFPLLLLLPAAAAVEVLVVGQNGSSLLAADESMEDREQRNCNNSNSGPMQNNSGGGGDRVELASPQVSGQVQGVRQQQYHVNQFHDRMENGDANSDDPTKLNRRSQSVKEICTVGSDSTDGRRTSTKFFARTRSLSKVADISNLLAAQPQLDPGRNPVTDRFSNRRFKSLTKPTRIHALNNTPNYSWPDSEVVEIPLAARSGSSKMGLGDDDGDDSRSNGGQGEGAVGKQKPEAVPEQSPIEEVALIVPTIDDPSLPVWTFRVWTLGLLSCILLSFLDTYFSYRYEPITLGVTTALILVFPLGQFMAAVLPNKFVRVPGTRYGFSLNPGEFNTKEHSLIVQFASGGSLRPGGMYVITLVKIYLKGTMQFFPGFVFLVTCELMGLCWGGLLQKFLVDPASMWWPSSLVNVSLVKALHTDEKGKGMSRIQFFMVCLMASFAYHVLPGYLFPTLSGISVVCYIFKHSTLAQQLGSGNRGLGLGAFSLDYATIISFLGSPLVVPSIAVINIIVGFVFQGYVFGPFTYWRNYYKAKNFPIFSSSLYTSGGQNYNVSRILTSQHDNFKFDRAGYDVEGPPYVSAFYAVSTGTTFMLFGCIVTQVLLFHGRDLWRVVKSIITASQLEEPDVHTHLMQKYPGVPARWYIALLSALHVISCVNVEVYKEQLQMKWWGVLLGDAIIAVLVLPICILVATTNQLPNLAIMSQYVIGYISPGEPVTSGVFRSYSTVVCGRVASYLANFKFGHYMKLPPRASFVSQALGTVVATLVSLAVTWWLTSTIDNICDTAHLPRNTPWTCPADKIFFDQSMTWGLVGPRRMFDKGGPYNSLNYYFLPGIFLPVVLWLLRWAFPDAVWITYINAPLIVRGAAAMPPASVVSNTTWLAIALVFSVYVFTYKKRWWQRYNYILSAALETGTVVMAVLLYYSMDEGKKRLHWWGERGNADHCPLARCQVGIQTPGCH